LWLKHSKLKNDRNIILGSLENTTSISLKFRLAKVLLGRVHSFLSKFAHIFSSRAQGGKLEIIKWTSLPE
jgi:hypothetical protein